MSDFPTRLRELREAAKLTQAELAERADMHQPAIARLEAGKRSPGLETLRRLAEALKIGPEKLLGKSKKSSKKA